MPRTRPFGGAHRDRPLRGGSPRKLLHLGRQGDPPVRSGVCGHWIAQGISKMRGSLRQEISTSSTGPITLAHNALRAGVTGAAAAIRKTGDRTAGSIPAESEFNYHLAGGIGPNQPLSRAPLAVR